MNRVVGVNIGVVALSCVPGSVAMVYGAPTDPYSIIISLDFNRYMMCISGAPGPNPCELAVCDRTNIEVPRHF